MSTTGTSVSRDMTSALYLAEADEPNPNHDADNCKANDYQPLVMDETDEGRPTADLRTEVLLELASKNNSNKPEDEAAESAQAAVERAKERRKIVVFMSTISHILLYVLPTLIVLCLILYWTIPNGEDHKWLTMLAAILGCACVLDFAIYQYFTNRREGTGFNNTLAKFRARLKRSGRRF